MAYREVAMWEILAVLERVGRGGSSGLRRLNAQQSSDFYGVTVERHRRTSTIVTSNRAIDEWIPLFDDPILAQSALDRLAHNAYQVVDARRVSTCGASWPMGSSGSSLSG